MADPGFANSEQTSSVGKFQIQDIRAAAKAFDGLSTLVWLALSGGQGKKSYNDFVVLHSSYQSCQHSVLNK